MSEATNSDLWKQAYRNQYGSDPDQDMAQHADEVEDWRINWQGGYDAGEQWAKDLLQSGPGQTGQMQSGGSGSWGQSQGGQVGASGGMSAMRTFADMERQNPNIRQQYDTWRNDVASWGQDATDWDAFRSYLTSTGAADPGSRPPDDFVGDDWKAQHPEWVARYGNRAA
jgi:hypothetical protein